MWLDGEFREGEEGLKNLRRWEGVLGTHRKWNEGKWAEAMVYGIKRQSTIETYKNLSKEIKLVLQHEIKLNKDMDRWIVFNVLVGGQ